MVPSYMAWMITRVGTPRRRAASAGNRISVSLTARTGHRPGLVRAHLDQSGHAHMNRWRIPGPDWLAVALTRGSPVRSAHTPGYRCLHRACPAPSRSTTAAPSPLCCATPSSATSSSPSSQRPCAILTQGDSGAFCPRLRRHPPVPTPSIWSVGIGSRSGERARPQTRVNSASGQRREEVFDRWVVRPVVPVPKRPRRAGCPRTAQARAISEIDPSAAMGKEARTASRRAFRCSCGRDIAYPGAGPWPPRNGDQ